jgi:hypothetical protein
MARSLIEERYTWPVRTVLLGGGSLWATSYQIFLSELTAPVIREAMASVRTIDVQQWVDTHLGPSMLARRRRALRPDMKTA